MASKPQDCLPGSYEDGSRVGRTTANAVRAAALTAVVLAGVAWVVTDHAVTLRIDGVAQTVHTHAADVRGVLRAAGVKVRPHDVITPQPESRVSSDTEVVLDRGRMLKLTVDGKTRRVWVTARSVDDALKELGLDDRRVRLSASRRARLPLSGFAVRVNTEKTVTLVADKRRDSVTTYAATVTDLLGERNVVLGEKDLTVPPRDAGIDEGQTITVRRITVRTVVETVDAPPPVTKKTDSALMLDQKKVLSPGRGGRVQRTVEYVYADGVLDKKNVLATKALVAPQPRVVVTGTKPYPPDDTGLNWAGLAKCESGGRPGVVSAGGTYHGLYQFNVDMWHRMGGIGLPSDATPREQTYRAIKLYKAAGRDQWPVCGRFL
jgi:uncharacterized protein YabE (DUF348 family)